MAQLTRAERLLQDLGVTEPKEIDLEAIAFHLGARVRFRRLDGCEARIIGCNDTAIITVREDSKPSRKRFSLAHEIGHWSHHRGKSLVCRVEESRPQDSMSPERIANMYAADLLMPNYLLIPAIRAYPKLTFKTITEVSEAFKTSLAATAIRIVEADYWPAFVINHSSRGRRWFARAPHVPSHWFPRGELDADSFAFGILHGERPNDTIPHKIGAEAWFERWEAEKYELLEQSMRTIDGEILTLLLITDQRMLDSPRR
jgi:hypothetical protein